MKIKEAYEIKKELEKLERDLQTTEALMLGAVYRGDFKKT